MLSCVEDDFFYNLGPSFLVHKRNSTQSIQNIEYLKTRLVLLLLKDVNSIDTDIINNCNIRFVYIPFYH